MRSSNQPNHSPKPPSPAAAASASGIAAAVELIPTGAFVLTAAYGESRGGVIVRWVQRVSSTPHLVVVAIEKGQPLSPVIRDSRRFGLCQLGPEDRVLHRIFEGERGDLPRHAQPSRMDMVDPFLGLPTRTTAAGVPILAKCQSWVECELTRHLDVEGNCELYIGLVHDGGVHRAPSQAAEAPSAAPPATTAPNSLPPHTNGHGHLAPAVPSAAAKPRPSRRRTR